MFKLILLLAIVIAVAAIAYKRSELIRRAIGEFEMSVASSFRLYSQRLNGFLSLVVLPYIIATNGGFVAQIVEKLPEGYRIVAAPFAGMLAFAVVTWARLRVQPPKAAK